MGSKRIAVVLALALMSGIAGMGMLARGTDDQPAPKANPASPMRPSRTVAAEGDKSDAKEPGKNDLAKEHPKTDHEKIQGIWRAAASEFDGKQSSPADLWTHWEFKDDTVTLMMGLSTIYSKFTLDPAKDPKQLTLTTENGSQLVNCPCIYKLEGEVLTVCMDYRSGVNLAKQRPKEFTGKVGAGTMLLTLKRLTPKKDEPNEKLWREKLMFKPEEPANWQPGGLFRGLVQFSPDGTRIQTASARRSGHPDCALLDMATGRDLTDPDIWKRDGYSVVSTHLGFGPDGTSWGYREVADGPSLVGHAVVNWKTGNERCRIPRSGRRAVLSPDAKVLACIDQKDSEVKLWNAATGKEIGALAGHPKFDMLLLSFSLDGKKLVTAGVPPRHYGVFDPKVDLPYIKIWDVATRKEIASRTIEGQLDMPQSDFTQWSRSMQFLTGDDRWPSLAAKLRGPAILPDGAAAIRHERVERGPTISFGIVWLLARLCVFPSGTDGRRGMAWYAKARGTWGNCRLQPAPLTILEVATGKEVARIAPPKSGYAAVTFSPDGLLLATQDNEGVVRIWERSPGKSGEKIRRLDE